MNHAQFWGGGGATSYQIEYSLRYPRNAYLYRTPSSSGNRTTWTYSCWFKRGTLYSDQAGYSELVGTVLAAGSTFNQNDWNLDQYRFQTNNHNFQAWVRASDTNQGSFITNAKYRDITAWYHVVIAYDSGNSTAADRVRFYINGERATTTNPVTMAINRYGFVNSTNVHRIGSGTSQHTQGYFAETHLLDGTAVTNADDFGEYNDAGVWVPKEVTGVTYGTNGFYMKFDPSAANGVGHDHSGNGNHFSASGFDTTNSTAATYDVMNDTPTTNYPTFNPLDTSRDMNSSFYLSNANLNLTVTNNSGYRNLGATFSPEGQKGYFEITWTTSASPNFYIGFMPINRSGVRHKNDYQYTGRGYGLWSYGYVEEGVTDVWVNYLSSFGSSDTLQIAFDFTGGNRNVWFGRNNTWGSTSGGTGNPATGANPALTATQLTGEQAFSFAINTGAGTQTIAINFGQRAFNYTPPTGFKAMNTSNMPAPDIADGSQHFDTVLYQAATSNGTYTHGNLDFRPDFTWIKNRDNVERHFLIDVVRGNTNVTDKFLVSSNTATEGTNGVGGTTFSVTNSGYQFVETTIGAGELYFNNRTYVGWNWKAGGSVSANNNTAGDINSTVSANTTAGFSIVGYTGNGSANQTIGHGLGVAPKMIIVKNRDTTNGWAILHTEVGTTGTTLDGAPEYYMMTFTPNSKSDFSTDVVWDPTSTTFKVAAQTNANWVNANGNDYIAYCFAEVEGYSKFGVIKGSYVADGPFVYLGFTPAFLMFKNAERGSTDWTLIDATRDPYNYAGRALRPNQSTTEDNYTERLDILSNGFKLRTSDLNYNGPDDNPGILYAAFASHPFGGSGVSPATAR